MLLYLILIFSCLGAIGAVVLLGTAVYDRLFPTQTWVCNNGHEAYGSRVRYCPYCGGRMRRRYNPTCPNGHKVVRNDKYCRRCGAKVVF